RFSRVGNRRVAGVTADDSLWRGRAFVDGIIPGDGCDFSLDFRPVCATWNRAKRARDGHRPRGAGRGLRGGTGTRTAMALAAGTSPIRTAGQTQPRRDRLAALERRSRD